MIKTIFSCVREYKKESFLSIFFVSLEVVMECLLPFIMKMLIDEMNGEELNRVFIYAGILIVMAFASLLFGALAGRYCAIASAGLSKNLREDLYKKICGFSFANIDSFSSSSLVTRMTTDVTNVQMAYMMIIRTAVRAPFMLIFSIIMSFIIAPNLAWIFVIVVPFLLYVLIVIIRFAMPRFKAVFKKYDRLNNSIQENINAIRTVKSYVREDYEIKKFDNAATDVKNDFTKAERIVAMNQPSMQFSIYTLNLVIIFLGASLIIKNASVNAEGEIVFGGLSTGGLSSLLTYGIQSLMSLMMLSMIIVMVTLAIESMRRIKEVMDTTSDIKNGDNPLYDVPNGDIEFKNVSFKYNLSAKKMALENVSFTVKSGQTVGIFGSTGSSKTTLVNLLSRLYDATEGQVIIGGHDVKEYDLQTLRNQVSVVLQKNLLFSGTIKDNLRWGNENATDEEMKRACVAACADEFIQGFKDKYDTHIEQGGSNVSGGQKQRLCIARALLKDPKVLVLDDSTSAVDTKTDAMIRNALKEEHPNITKVIISQRISSIEESDLILILDKGNLVAKGTHEELLQNCDIYKEVYESQNRIKGGNENA